LNHIGHRKHKIYTLDSLCGILCAVWFWCGSNFNEALPRNMTCQSLTWIL